METTQNDNREWTFEELISKHSLLITKVCYYFSNSLSEFQDLRQDVLVNIWSGLEKFRYDSGLSTWIYRVCFNTCISYRRKNINRRKEIPINSILEFPDSDSFDIENYNELHRLINLLSPEDKAIILMWLDENSYEEIAEVVGLNRNTVATRIKRIKEKLIKLSNQ